MSSLYKRYLSFKIENSDNFYLFESGIFYLFIDNDAKFMSNILNLKLTNLNSQIVKCGFPTSHLDKYLKILKDMNYSNIQIVSSNSFLAYSQNVHTRLRQSQIKGGNTEHSVPIFPPSFM